MQCLCAVGTITKKKNKRQTDYKQENIVESIVTLDNTLEAVESHNCPCLDVIEHIEE